MSTSCLTVSTRDSTVAVAGKLMSREPMNRWSYSAATDQFGAKPNSTPVPTVPPQRVSLVESSSVPTGKGAAAFAVPVYLLWVTAAPPFTYQSTLPQAYPTWPVNRPIASVLVVLVRPAASVAVLAFDDFRSVQLP